MYDVDILQHVQNELQFQNINVGKMAGSYFNSIANYIHMCHSADL